MTKHRNHRKDSGTTRSGAQFWKSRSGIGLLAFFGVVGLLLAFEHRAHLVTSDGLLVLLLASCIIVHFFMHGGHGGSNGGNEA